MYRKYRIITTTVAMGIASLLSFPAKVFAQEFDLCSIFGPLCIAVNPDGDGLDGQDAFDYAAARINILVSLIFVGIIIVAIFIIVRSGVKYIQSQGNAEMIADAQNAMRNVFIGIAVLFVGIIGVVLVLAFFGGANLLESGVSLSDIFNL